MPFAFTLGTLLRVREIREKAALQRLQMIASQVAAKKAEIDALDKNIHETRREICNGALTGLSGAELHFQAMRDSAQRERRQTFVQKLQELEKIHQEQRKLYLQARQKKEVLSNLREQQLAAYNLEESRKQQRNLDEVYLLRMAFRRNEVESSQAPNS